RAAGVGPAGGAQHPPVLDRRPGHGDDPPPDDRQPSRAGHGHPARTVTVQRSQTDSTRGGPEPPRANLLVPPASMATFSIWTCCSKAPSPVILKFPPPYLSKLVQSKAHWMRQRSGARNPGLRSPPVPWARHSTSSGLLVGPYEVGGVVGVVAPPGPGGGGGGPRPLPHPPPADQGHDRGQPDDAGQYHRPATIEGRGR